MKKLRLWHFSLRFIISSVLTAIISGSLSSQIPTITSFTPASGPVGTKVTINGINFNPVPTYNSVWFGAVQATVTAATSTSLVVTVPSGATFQPFTVTVNGFTEYSAVPFKVTFPGSKVVDATTFATKIDLTPGTGTGPYGVAISDIDGDGKPDIVATNLTNNTLSIYRNISLTSTINAGTFAAKVDIGTGIGPYGIAIGDIDGDGKPDLVVTNFSANTVSVFRNTNLTGAITTASFAARVDFPVGTNPYSVAINDIDGDGKSDLVVTNQNGNNISILRNTSIIGTITTSSFSPKVDFTTGANPYYLAIGDIDGDGKPDIAVTNKSGNSVSIFRNTSTPGIIYSASFDPKYDLTTGTGPWGITLGDLDGDNKADLAVANFNANSISIFRNTAVPGPISSTSFGTRADLVTGINPQCLAIADIEGDGKPDLVVTNYGGANISAFRNISTSGSLTTSSFSLKTDFPTGTGPLNLAIADIDGDSKSDITVINGTTNNVSVLQNTTKTPNLIAYYPFNGNTNDESGYGNNGTPAGGAAPDSDRFGIPASAYNFNGLDGYILINDPIPNNLKIQNEITLSAWINVSQLPAELGMIVGSQNDATTSGASIMFDARVNSDGQTSPAGHIHFQLGDGSWHVTNSNSLVPLNKWVLITATRKANENAKIYYNSDLQPVTSAAWTGGITYTDSWLAIGRQKTLDRFFKGSIDEVRIFNRALTATEVDSLYHIGGYDIRPTITSVVPSSGPVGSSVTLTGTNFSSTPENNFVWFGAVRAIITSASSTSLTVVVPAGASYKPVTVTVNGYTGYSGTFFNVTFPGTRVIDATAFPTKTDLPVGTSPYYGVISDIDGDWKPDLIISNNASSTFSVFRNQSTSGSISAGSFATRVDINTGTSPFGIAVGDIDGDGKQDVVVANSGSNTISVFRNISTSGSISSASFAPKVDLNTGSGPYGVAIGDLDSDGKPDLVVTNGTSNTISIFRNTSTPGTISSASFPSRVDITTGSTPQNLAINDIDGDDKPEIIVANKISNSISIYRNISTPGIISEASFANRVDLYSTSGYPSGLTFGDIDGDGLADLIVTNFGNNSVSVFRNVSTPGPISISSFAPKVDFPTGAGPNGLSISDLDGDNKVDLITVNSADGSVSALRNTSTSGSVTSTSFALKADFTAGTWPQGTIAGDLDGDGKPDLVVINQNTNNISILRNTISGPPVITSFSPSSGPIGTTVTINGNNFSATAANNIVWFGAVKATVVTASSTTLTVGVPAGATYEPISVTVNGSTDYSNAPFNVTFSSSQLINAASFGLRADISSGISPYCVAIHDIDGDGKPDILVTNANSNTISIFRNISTSGSLTAGSFAAKVDFATGISPYNIAVGDIDGDGKPDIAVTNYNGGTISVFRNASTSGTITTSSLDLRVDLITGSNPYGIAIGDIDGDGKPDIIVTSPGSFSLSVFQNNGTPGSITAGTFATRFDITTSAPLYGIASGDIDKDGRTDLSAASTTTNTVSVFRNISSPGPLTTSSFETPIDFTTGVKPYAIALGDIDGDGKPDIVTANNTANTLSVLRNNSSPGSITAGSISGNVDYPTGLSPYMIAIADVDGNGKPDLANGYNSGGTYVSILKNTSTSGIIGPGSIATRFDFTTQSAPYCIAFGDLDGDGKPDLVAANYSSSTISVFRNTMVLPPTAPVVGTITQPTCLLTTGSVILSGLPSAGSWTITRSPGGTTTTGTGTSTTISGLLPGTYTFTVTTTSNGVSAASSNVVILTAKSGVVPVIKSKWRDLLICSNVGDSIVSYQWYIGNTAITGAKSQTYWSKKVAGVYKVVTVDKNGCINTSNTVQITGTKSFSVYPNPASDIINISLNDEPSGSAVILLHNATGKIVLRLETNKEFDELLEEIPVSNLDPGIYYLKVTINQVNVYNSKVVLIK